MELPEKILAVMSNTDTPVESLNLAQEFNEDHQKVVGAIKSLECLGDLIQAEIKPQKQWHVIEQGEDYLWFISCNIHVTYFILLNE